MRTSVQFGAHGIERVEIARVHADVAHEDRLASGGSRAGDAFIQADGEILGDLVAMADGVAHLQGSDALIVEKDGYEFVRNDVLDDLGDVGKEAIKVERFGGDRADFEQEVEEFGALLEADLGFAGRRHLVAPGLGDGGR